MARRGGAGGIILIAIILGLVTAFLFYRNEQKRNQQDRGNWRQVVVAALDIKARTRITADMVKPQPLPKELIAEENPITNVADVVGRVTLNGYREKEQLRSADLLAPGQAPAISYKVPDGMRAVAIGGDEVRFVGTGVKPGDRVDLITTVFDARVKSEVTKTILQNVLVLAVNRADMDPNSPGGAQSSITLAVKPEHVELVKAAEVGRGLSVSLRSNRDQKLVETTGVLPQTLTDPNQAAAGDTEQPKMSMPVARVVTPSSEAGQKPEKHEIKVIRGTVETTVDMGGESH